MQVINFILGLLQNKSNIPVTMGALGVCLFLIVLPGYAAAQQQCDIIPEAILKLNPPDIGAYSVWSAVHGDYKHSDQYVRGIPLENGKLVVLGERQLDSDWTVEGEDHLRTLLFTVLDDRGRVFEEHVIAVKGFQHILKILPVSGREHDSYVVLATVKERDPKTKWDKTVLWLGFLSADGNVKGHYIIRHNEGSFVNADLAPAKNGGYILVTGIEKMQYADGSAGERFSVFYNLNPQGRVMSSRSYQIGLDNEMESLDVFKMDDKQWHYIVSGRIKNGQGDDAGWLMRLDQTGNFIWQRQFSRGAGAVLLKSFVSSDGRVFTAGRASPTNEEGLQAGWVLEANPDNGDVIWQRYLTGYAHYNIQDVYSDSDGVVSLLLNAKPVGMKDMVEGDSAGDDGQSGRYRTQGGIMGRRSLEQGEKYEDHAMIVTLGPRGSLIDSQVFFNGEGAYASQMLRGSKRNFVLLGQTDVFYRFEEPVLLEVTSLQGWGIATTPMSAYEDPCRMGNVNAPRTQGFE